MHKRKAVIDIIRIPKTDVILERVPLFVECGNPAKVRVAATTSIKYQDREYHLMEQVAPPSLHQTSRPASILAIDIVDGAVSEIIFV